MHDCYRVLVELLILKYVLLYCCYKNIFVLSQWYSGEIHNRVNHVQCIPI